MPRRRRREQGSLAFVRAEPAVDAILRGRDAGRERMGDARVVVGARQGVRRQRQGVSRSDLGAQRFRPVKGLVRHQDRPLDVASELLVPVLDELPGRIERLEGAGDDHEQRVAAKIVEQRRRRLEEQRQVVLDAGRQLRVGDQPINRAAAGLDGKVLTETLAKSFDRCLVERELACREDLDLVGLAGGELSLRVERAQALDLVIEQVDTDRRGAARGEYIEHGAADGELAGLGDLLDAQVAVLAQALRHLRRVEPVADGQRQRPRDDELGWRQALEQRAGLED
jgi:hypothetical protein